MNKRELYWFLGAHENAPCWGALLGNRLKLIDKIICINEWRCLLGFNEVVLFNVIEKMPLGREKF